MENNVVIFRNIAGDVSRETLDEWKKVTASSGVHVEEKGKGKTLVIHLRHEDDDLVFYLYEQTGLYQLHIEYMRVKNRSGKMVMVMERLIEMCKLRAEKYDSNRAAMIRTFYVNGLVMDSSPCVESEPNPDLELLISREAILGHIYLKLDALKQAKEDGNEEHLQDLLQTLKSYSEELKRIQNTLQH